MKRALFFFAALLLSLAYFAPAAGADDTDDKKVTICHAAGLDGTTKYVTLTLSVNAVFKDQGGHFYENGTPQAGHEQDYLGACVEPTTPPTEPPVTPIPPVVTPEPSTPSVTPEAPSTPAETPSTEKPREQKPDKPEKPREVTPPPVAPEPPSSGRDELAHTGMNAVQVAGIGGGLVAAGALLYFGLGRREIME